MMVSSTKQLTDCGARDMPTLSRTLEPRRAWSRTLSPLVLVLVLSGCGSGSDAGDGGSGSDAGNAAGSLAPDPDAPPVTAPPGTPLHHAQTCAQYLGPIPAVSCMDAEIMPITVDGVEVQETPATCDRPSALTGTCETGERISARYIGTHHDGTPRPEVVFINFCRDGGQGLIGHNSETGATCFFHMNQDYPNTVQHPGSDDPDYDDYWQTAEEVAADNCQGCHQADPWLHSPWIDQLRDPDDPSLPLVPLTASTDSPYVVVGDGFTQPYHDGAPGNSCTSCHRPQCDTGFAVPLGQLVMPGPFEDSNFHDTVSTDLQELRDWCETLPNGGFGGPSDEDSGECDAFYACYVACSSYSCVGECAEAHWEGAELEVTRALLACMESAGCGLLDLACAEASCEVEFDRFDENCE